MTKKTDNENAGDTSITGAQSKQLASQRSRIDNFLVMEVMRAADAREDEGHDIIHMEVGQPGTPAPQLARDALASALDQQTLGYTAALGITPLRERIARHYQDTYGVEIPYQRIVITTGSSGAFVLAFLAAFDAGARVALPTPGYPCYRHILSALGQHTVLLPTDADTRWMPTPEQISDIDDREKLHGLLIASPANPTGTMISQERLAQICELCTRRKIWFISDEIYHGLTYLQKATTALQHSDDAIVINSFSKYYSMTGWRVGWMVVPERLVRPIERLAQNLFISPPAVSQVAALGAFDADEELERNKNFYAQNRKRLMHALPKAGFNDIAPADGAFYLYCNVEKFTDDAVAFTRAMLDEIGVAATPGIDFDAERGHHYVRFSYAGTPANMETAINRLQSWSRLKSKS